MDHENLISSYYIEKYRKPQREAVFVAPAGDRIEIYKWDETQTGEDVAIYATLGANSVLGAPDAGCEFFIGLTPDADDIVEALAEVALHGNGTTRVPSRGDTITLAYPLWQSTEMRSFLFTDGTEIIEPATFGEKQITFLQLVPLFESELSFKEQHGESGLWKSFEKNLVPYWDSARKPAF